MKMQKLFLTVSALLLFSACNSLSHTLDLNTDKDTKESLTPINSHSDSENSEGFPNSFPADTPLGESLDVPFFILEEEPQISHLAVSPDGQQFAIADHSNDQVSIYSTIDSSYHLEKTIDVPSPGLVRWSPDGKVLGIASFDNRLRTYSYPQGVLIAEVRASEGYAPDFQWSTDGEWIMVLVRQPSSGRGEIFARLYQTAFLILVKEYRLPSGWEPNGTVLNFDWNRDEPEKMQMLVRTEYGLFFMNGDDTNISYLDFPALDPLSIFEIHWIAADRFIAVSCSEVLKSCVHVVEKNEIIPINPAEDYTVLTNAVIDPERRWIAFLHHFTSLTVYTINPMLSEIIGEYAISGGNQFTKLTYNPQLQQVYVYDWGKPFLRVINSFWDDKR